MRVWIAALLLAGVAQAQDWQPYSPALVAQANAGDAAAQYALGEAYRSGNGVVANRDQAIAWFRKAAPRDLRAADALGVLLFVKGERKQAIPLLQAASQRGSAQALYILGTARFNGDYVPRDVGAAYAEMRLAAQKGLPEAQRSLALMDPYVTTDDRIRADALAAQPNGPETGALPLPPPPPVARVASPSVRTVKTPMVTVQAGTPAPTTIPDGTPTAPLAGSQPPPLATIELPPLRPAPASPVMTAPAVKPPSAVAAPAKTGSGNWRVQLAAVGSPAAAESEWKRLIVKAPALAPLDHAAVPAGAITRLQAIGLATRADAAALCRQLAGAGLGCFVLPPAL